MVTYMFMYIFYYIHIYVYMYNTTSDERFLSSQLCFKKYDKSYKYVQIRIYIYVQHIYIHIRENIHLYIQLNVMYRYMLGYECTRICIHMHL